MLSNFLSHRVSGTAGLRTLPNTAALSRELGQRSRARRAALESYKSGGRAVHSGLRLDARGGVVSDNAARAAMLHMYAAEHVDLARSMGRMDATIPQASQALTYFLNEVYQIEKSGLPAWDGEILPIDRAADPAAEEIVWYEKDLVGAPRAGNTYDLTTIPMVTGPVASSNKIGVIPALVGLENNFMDARRSAMARSNGKPDFAIEQGKIEIARRVIAEMGNALWLAGDSTLAIDGLFSSPLIGDVPVSPGLWSTLTGTQLVAELKKLFNYITNQAQGGNLADMSKVTVMLPPDQFDLVREVPVTAAGSQSAWAYFRDSNGLRDDQLVKRHVLAAANSAVFEGGPAVLARDTAFVKYTAGDRWDPRFVLPQDIEIPAAPRNTGLGEVTIMHARMGGIMIPDSRRIVRYEGL